MSGFAPYAADARCSRGRQYPESAPEFRDEYQRDRDRVIHSSAFRRLEYKTQVFVNHEGDMFRTRLTHSIEVAQIGRTIARALAVNEDLTEAICLAHDLGHTPFGHSGQDALNKCMLAWGGFEHNLQSLRVVDVLEEKYAGFRGLNLMFETREGILKHCSAERAARLAEVGERFLSAAQPGIEAQVANIADEIAYNNHDVDDGLRAGLLSLEELKACDLFGDSIAKVSSRWSSIGSRIRIHESVRMMINDQVRDVVNTSLEKLQKHSPQSINEVRAMPEPLIGFSASMQSKHQQIKQFLRRFLYAHYRVQRMAHKAGNVISTLFDAFLHNHGLLPHAVQTRIETVSADGDEIATAQVIADYIASMTDRYAIAEFNRITNPNEAG